ncbi:MAG TPA: ATP-binding protein, partial [Verrucomicrobiae bacterium]|nr:ATP-binding protein [Verrucomicrobiae bacterium]
GTNIPAFQAFFASMKKVYTNYTDFGLIETNGHLVVCSIPGKTGVNLTRRADFQHVLATREFSVGEYGPASGATHGCLFCANPIFSGSNQLARVIYAALDLEVLNKVAAEAQLPKGSAIEIFDPGHHILARFPEPERWIGRSVSDSSFAETVVRDEEGTIQARGLDDIGRLCAFTSVKTGGHPSMFVIVGIPTELAYAETTEAVIRNLIILGIVALLALVAAWSYANSYILQPVKTLVGATKRLAAGDLTARAGGAGSSGEFNQLTQAFDEMAAGLQRQRAEIEESGKEIRALNAGLEQRVLERTRLLEEANTELEAFSYSVSHDLRAPLRHIHAYAEMVREDFSSALGQSGQQRLGLILNAVGRMSALIDDLLDFSRLSRAEMLRTPVKMEGAVREVINEMESDLRGRSIEWKIGPLPEVIGDRSMLKQVWANLLGNAVKYTRKRDASQIEIKCVRKGSSEWEFSVRDNGAGFNMQYAGKLFGVFQRLHSEREFEGMGIGLANVRRIIQRHGGTTRAEGEVDQGATIYFTLPV